MPARAAPAGLDGCQIRPRVVMVGDMQGFLWTRLEPGEGVEGGSRGVPRMPSDGKRQIRGTGNQFSATYRGAATEFSSINILAGFKAAFG